MDTLDVFTIVFLIFNLSFSTSLIHYAISNTYIQTDKTTNKVFYKYSCIAFMLIAASSVCVILNLGVL